VLAVDKVDYGTAYSGDLKSLVCDLTETGAPISVVDRCVAAFGRVDILVNCAGLGNAPPLHDTTDAIYQRYIDINLGTTFRLMRDAIGELSKTRGCIINIASTGGIVGYRGLAAYSAAKAAVVGLTRAAAAEYGPPGIRVNAVAPGIVATPATKDRLATAQFRAVVLGTMPLGRVGQIEDIAAAVAFLASDDASYVTGQVLAVDGGQSTTTFLGDEVIEAYSQAQAEKSR
jgi:NAD(P)-dependent dehydrogenase (short-subunit alcohol dehydrogenase family)